MELCRGSVDTPQVVKLSVFMSLLGAHQPHEGLSTQLTGRRAQPQKAVAEDRSQPCCA